MIFAKIDADGLVLDTIVANSTDIFPEGKWVKCPQWVGIGMNIDTPKPEEPEFQIPIDQPVVSGIEAI